MNHVVAVTSHNRPEMLDACLDYLSRSGSEKGFDTVVYQDGPEHFFSEDTLSDYGVKDWHTWDHNIGLSKNILFCLRDMFEERGYDLVTILEDDVLVSSDFIEWVQRCSDLINPEIFTISGFGNVSPQIEYSLYPHNVYLTDWYFTGGVTFRVEDYMMIKDHINSEFFRDSGEYLHYNFGPEVRKKNPFFFDYVFFPNGRVRWPLQAGLINCIRVANGKKQITPELSRCQNIGYYGFNQGQKRPDGTDVRDPENWRKGLYFNPTWQENFPTCYPVIADGSHYKQLRNIEPWKK